MQGEPPKAGAQTRGRSSHALSRQLTEQGAGPSHAGLAPEGRRASLLPASQENGSGVEGRVQGTRSSWAGPGAGVQGRVLGSR